MTRRLMVAMVLVLGLWAVALAEQNAVEVFGNTNGAEVRYLMLGPQGGAIGLYGGLADGLLADEDNTTRFGAIGRYNIITEGGAPVGNLLPQFLNWFKNALSLPDTTPVDTYVGLAIGGIYGTDHGKLAWEVRPHVGLRVGVIGFEFGRGLGDLLDEPETPSSWTWAAGLNFQF